MPPSGYSAVIANKPKVDIQFDSLTDISESKSSDEKGIKLNDFGFKEKSPVCNMEEIPPKPKRYSYNDTKESSYHNTTSPYFRPSN